jgi:O-antigen/teichoic acid export membrane protein
MSTSSVATVRDTSRSLVERQLVAQTALYTLSSVLTGLLGGVAKALLARVLSVVSLGIYSLAYSVLQFGALLFEFGLFLPAARLSAGALRTEQRDLMGAATVLYVPVGVAYAASVFAFSFVCDSLFKVHAGIALAVTAPLAVVYPFAYVALQLTQGVGRLHLYSVANLVGQVFFTAALVVVVEASAGLNPSVALMLRGASLGIAWATVVVWLWPRFRRVRANARLFVSQARAYGFEVYVGRVMSTATYNMDVLMLGALTDARSVGLYALAGAIAAVVSLPTLGLGKVLFPRMVQDERLDKRLLTFSWATGLAGTAAAWFLSARFVGAFFSPAYAPAAHYVLPLALAETLRGVTGMYNSYLSAQAAGRRLRNAGLVLTMSNVILNFALIPPYGASGAAWASVLALLANLVAHIVGYRRLQTERARTMLPDTQTGTEGG